ncbi:MAG: PAS domain S-box protein [Gammaproteobacteria bacterium]|nr:PAS domain S-box protein [Gammaproteobacteria bacterium]
MAAPTCSSDECSRRNHDPAEINTAGCGACEIAQRFMSLIEAGPSVIVCLSPDCRILEFNRAAVRLYGRQRASVLGQDYIQLFVPKAHQKLVVDNIKRILDGFPTRSFENPVRTPDGEQRVLLWSISRILDVAGVPTGVIAVGQDITERQQADEALIEQQRQLRTLASELALAGQRERRRVAIGLHDQVGQALAMAKLKLRAVLDSDLSANTRRSLMESQALLDQSIQATRSLTFQLSSAVLRELGLEAALQQLVEWFDAEHKDTRFVFETDNQAKPVSEEKDLMIYDIARELLFNATKYAQARTVSLTVECVNDHLHILIQDDGVGFDTTRLKDAPSAEGGVGYFSIRERLNYLGGELDVESSIGHGTRTTLIVPCDEP